MEDDTKALVAKHYFFVSSASCWARSINRSSRRSWNSVAVVGTGASGVQVVQEAARVAEHVTVFQRQDGAWRSIHSHWSYTRHQAFQNLSAAETEQQVGA